jgi:hypothetical protein
MSDGMADASAEDDMDEAGGGAVAVICIDARRGKLSADRFDTSGYAEEFIGEERCWCWIGLGGMTTDCWLSSSSSRSRLFEGGLAAGTSRLPAVVRSLSRSLPKLVGVYSGVQGWRKITHRSRPAIDHRVSAVSSIIRHFRTSCISFSGSSVVPDLLAPHKLRRRTTAEENADNCANHQPQREQVRRI